MRGLNATDLVWSVRSPQSSLRGVMVIKACAPKARRLYEPNTATAHRDVTLLTGLFQGLTAGCQRTAHDRGEHSGTTNW